ncbi:MAG: hydrogenase maturation nickel metallochaperone HypA [Pirellulales bacterium]|nr:hydrogenase maturation nickel metallochaperone HypA [Pirellulales bacterium]
MHEVSLVRTLLQQVCQIASQNRGLVSSIEIEIGAISGVEPELVELAFEQLKQEFLPSNPDLIIRKQPIVVICQQCRKRSALAGFAFRCAHCDEEDVRIVQGEQFRLLTITLEQDSALPEENHAH